jgi:hypothetical protein
MKEKLCRYCGKKIPNTNHGSSQHCNDDCTYQAKKKRSRAVYHEKGNKLSILTKNEKILSYFYPLVSASNDITFKMLDSMGFKWGVYEAEVFYLDRKCKKIGNFYYYINSDKTIYLVKK